MGIEAVGDTNTMALVVANEQKAAGDVNTTALAVVNMRKAVADANTMALAVVITSLSDERVTERQSLRNGFICIFVIIIFFIVASKQPSASKEADFHIQQLYW